ncbi:MAG: hypothetical protein BWK73_04325 [Thiothrix lacustris]|uniref:Cadherin domain-containing protein n=1 Tax=Thiothrix lacustris TaxID=525917 RepID=A0A1Y1QYD9_9GAMM|nr:MAG: hypothetical protein BWK73_04325 [Thiothrix lacustris]
MTNIACTSIAFAEGTKQWAPAASNDAALAIASTGYTFAAPGVPADNRLYIHIENPDSEVIYIGLSNNTQFTIRAPDGTVKHGPYTINNISSHAQAVAGPAAITSGGYPISSEAVFDPTGLTAGDYYIEFPNGTLITWFDITVANKGATPTAIDGRVWSKSWAVRAENAANPDPYGEPFAGTFYAYDSKNLTTKIDFDNSGLRPLYGQFSFNDTGTGNTGNKATDRQSVSGNHTNPQHKVFLNPPDPLVYPLGSQGQLQNLPLKIEDTNNTAIQVEATQSGRVEIILDINGDGSYTAATDRRLFADVVAGVNAVPWDGKDGADKIVTESQFPFKSMISYTQGETHFTAYDVEGLDNGFQVYTQTASGTVGPNLLFWDDSKISASAGNISPVTKVNTDTGNTVRQQWNNNAYGDLNTINTWWFAYRDYQTSIVKLLHATPVITSNEGGSTAAIRIREGISKVTTIAATDADIGDTLTYSISGGTNSALFNIDPLTNELNFITAPALGTYQVIVKVDDGTGRSDTQTLTVTVAKDTDGDELFDADDLDIDGDGIPNSEEGTADTDNDGISNQFDLDSDNDGIPDNIEAQTTAGYNPPSGTVAANGIDTAYGAGLAPVNTDGADTPDYLDTNADNSGTDDTAEAGITLAGADADGDGLDDAVDSDDASFGSANAGITDVLAAYPNNGTNVYWRLVNAAPVIPNPAAIDYVEKITAPVVDLAATDDANSEGNGLSYAITGGDDQSKFDLDTATGALTFKATPSFAAPADKDGNNTYLVEVAVADIEGVTTKKLLTITVLKDTDKDGIGDKNDLDLDGDGIPNSVEGTADFDGDGIPNQFDLDSDGDGIPDNIEAQTTAGFLPPSGVDANKNGIDDAYGAGLTPVDTESDSKPDYLDLDSENTGGDDNTEADLPPLSGVDADGDGLDDTIDTDDASFGPANAGITDVLAAYPKTGTEVNWRVPNTPPVFESPAAATFDENSTAVVLNVEVSDDKNTEAASGIGYSIVGSNDDARFTIDPKTGDIRFKLVPNYEVPVDKNKDNAYTLTVKACDSEGGCSEQTIIINVLDVDEDNDNDGLMDSKEAELGTDRWNPDTDGDGLNDGEEVNTLKTDPLKPDTDGDGLSDSDEVLKSKTDPLKADTDADGVNDGAEVGADPATPADTDADGTADAFDTDDDNDGTPTADEAPDANSDLNPDDARNTDGDLLPDYLDNDDDGDGVLSQYEDPTNKRDSDKDGIVDTLDDDDDNDGLLTEYEQADPNKDGNPADRRDTDKDGIADWLDTDDDGDGVLTQYEMADKDGNGNPTDATDTDADGKFNWLDVDDDNDGVLTKYEKPDADANGNPSDALDTDTDSKPNYLDSDDDGDSKLTVDEKADKNKDGNPLDAYDADADGIPSYLDPNEIPTVVLHVRGFLQGAYSTADDLMRDDLRKQGLIPAVQPYSNAVTSLGYTGAEALAPSLLTLDDNNAPVDWVVVELRSKTSPKTVVARAAAILQRDGDVADPQTNEAKLLIPNVVEGQYFVSLRHRNHLGVTTQDAMLLSPTLTAVDFTLVSQTVMGSNARLLGKDAALMWAGEANNNDSVIANGPGNDTNVVLGTVLMHPTNLLTNSNFRLKGYYVTDLNLDGISLYAGPSNDINLLLGNVLLHPSNSLMAANYILLGAIPK